MHGCEDACKRFACVLRLASSRVDWGSGCSDGGLNARLSPSAREMFEFCQKIAIEGKFWEPQEGRRQPKKHQLVSDQGFLSRRYLSPPQPCAPKPADRQKIGAKGPKFPLDSKKLAKIGLEPCADRFGQLLLGGKGTGDVWRVPLSPSVVRMHSLLGGRESRVERPSP